MSRIALLLGQLRVIVCFVVLAAGARTAGAQQPAWRANIGADVKRLSLTVMGAVLVQTDQGVTAFAADSGTRLWSRPDLIEVAAIGDMPLGVGRSGNGLRLIDLTTGADRWDFAKLGMANPTGYVSVPSRGELLVYGPTAASPMTMLSAELDSGAVRWRQDSLLDPSRREAKPFALSQHAAPVLVGDSSILLDADEAGLLNVRLADGAVLWRLPESAIDLDKVSHVRVADGTIYVVRERTLFAVDPTSGAVRWKSQRELPYPMQPLTLAPSSSGLVVGGAFMHTGWSTEPRIYLDLIDPSTGASRWAKNIEIRGRSPFLLRGDTIFQAVTKGFRAFEAASGKVLSEGQFPELGGGEEPLLIEPLDDGDFVLISAQNLLRVAPDGQVKYHRYLKAPGSSMLAKVAAVTAAVAVTAVTRANAGSTGGYYLIPTGLPLDVLQARYHATANANRYAYIYTGQTLEGGDGFDLVRFDKASGTEKGRVRLADRRPTYIVEPVSGTVVSVVGKELVAYRYPPS